MLLVVLDRWLPYTERLYGNLLEWTQHWSSYKGGRLNTLDCINIITTILIILRPKIVVFFYLFYYHLIYIIFFIRFIRIILYFIINTIFASFTTQHTYIPLKVPVDNNFHLQNHQQNQSLQLVNMHIQYYL